MKTLIKLASDRRGAGTVEYGLLAALIVLGGLSALDSVKKAANGLEGRITVGFGAPRAAPTSLPTLQPTGSAHGFHIADDGTITKVHQ